MMTAADPPAPLGGLTPAQRAALAHLLDGRATKYRGHWRATDGFRIAGVTMSTLYDRGLVRLVRPAVRCGVLRASLTDHGRWLACSAARSAGMPKARS